MKSPLNVHLPGNFPLSRAFFSVSFIRLGSKFHPYMQNADSGGCAVTNHKEHNKKAYIHIALGLNKSILILAYQYYFTSQTLLIKLSPLRWSPSQQCLVLKEPDKAVALQSIYNKFIVVYSNTISKYFNSVLVLLFERDLKRDVIYEAIKYGRG